MNTHARTTTSPDRAWHKSDAHPLLYKWSPTCAKAFPGQAAIGGWAECKPQGVRSRQGLPFGTATNGELIPEGGPHERSEAELFAWTCKSTVRNRAYGKGSAAAMAG
jgi:hypothetical protein